MTKKLLILFSFTLLLTSCESKKINSSVLDQTSLNSSISNEMNEKKNVILFIGDGMGNSHVNALSYLYKDQVSFINFGSNCQTDTNSLDENFLPNRLTDSSASGTAMATGVITINGYVGKDKDGNDLKTIIDISKGKSYRTGIITTDYLYGATPASFSSHSLSRKYYEEIVLNQSYCDINYLLGLKDNLYLDTYRQNFIDNGYVINDDFSKESELFNKDKLLLQYDIIGGGKTIHFKDCVKNALDYLTQDDTKPFILVAEQANIDKKSHSNDFEGMITNITEFNEGINYAFEKFKNKKDTIIIVTADHETGGLLVSENNIYPNSYTCLESNKTIYYEFTTKDHTNKTIGTYIFNHEPKYEMYPFYHNKCIIKNSELFSIMNDIIVNDVI